MGPGGSRLANYGVSAELPKEGLHHTGTCRSPGRRENAGPQTTRQWQRWAQLEVTLSLSLRPPEVTSLQVSWEADLQALRSWRGLGIQPCCRLALLGKGGNPKLGEEGTLVCKGVYLAPLGDLSPHPQPPKGCFPG